MLDASIPLSTQPVQVQSPMTSLGQLMQARESVQNLALNAAKIDQQKAQAAEQQAQADQKTRDLADQNAVMQAFQEPDSSKRLHLGDFTDLESKVQPKTLDSLRTNHINYQKNLNALTTEQQGIRSKALGSIVDTVSGLKSLIGEDGDTSRVNEQLPGIVASLKANNVLKDAGFPDLDLPNQVQDPKQLDSFLAAVGGQQAAIDKALSNKKEQAGIAASESLKLKDDADAAKANADAKLIGIKTELMQNGAKPGAVEASVSGFIDPAKYPDAYTHAVAAAKIALAAGDVDGSAKAIKDIYDKEVQPGLKSVVDNETAKKKAEFEATAPEREAEAKRLADYNRSGNIANQKEMVDFRNSQPTSQTRSMAETAPKVLELIDKVKTLVDQQEKDLGPGSSRVREFFAGKVGEKDAEYTKLRTNVGLLQTALMRMHVGARGGQEMMHHFTDLIDSAKQDPDNLRAALGEIRDYALEVAKSSPSTKDALADKADNALPGGITLDDINAELERRKKKGGK